MRRRPRLVVINRVHQPVGTTLEDARTGTRLSLDLASKEVRLFRLEAGGWMPLAAVGRAED